MAGHKAIFILALNQLMKKWKIYLILLVCFGVIICSISSTGLFDPQSEKNFDEAKQVVEAQISAPSAPDLNSDSEQSPNHEALAEELMTMLAEVWPQSQADPEMPGLVSGVMEKGDTIGKILEEAGSNQSQHYINAMRKVFSLGAFKAGQPYIVVTDPDSGQLKRFEYEINATKRLVVEGDDKPSARLEKIEYNTFLEVVAATIDDNLFQAVAEAGENPQLAVRLTELFGSEINFIRDIQKGDSFVVLIEKRYRQGEYKGYGRILAARFVNKGKSWEAFLFNDGSGKSQYYNARGENLNKTLLQAPLAVTRVTSRFSHNRKHPLLGYTRPHLGVDYGAPTGTPVKAVGGGTVTKRGWAGGYGNQIIIKHNAGLESMYSHLSGFARGLKEGQKVRQGQVIGFVGSTGLSTGPHLDFRLRQKGEFVNPAKAINPRGEPVEVKRLSEFKSIAERERAWLDGNPLPENYTVDSIIPLNVTSPTTKEIRQADRTRVKPNRRATMRARPKRRS